MGHETFLSVLTFSSSKRDIIHLLFTAKTLRNAKTEVWNSGR